MLIRTLLPWHEAVWSHHFLGRSRPQSLLLTAVRGTGEAAFAHGAAASLLCADPTPQGLACGTCAECHWLDTGEHPDLKLLDPSRAATDAATAAEPAADDGDEKTKRSRELITVDDVRAATTFLQLAAHRGRARVVLIHPAHAMNVAAANALLKALEEPPTGAYFILVTSQPARLPATIRSRCIRVDLPKPDHAVAADWLQSQGIAQPTLALAQSGGAPIAAAEL
ncbi:MAG: DNA polymerase III subunit delta', partial [Burkholderiales bacterium]|nr:DNA polymerase III subunit delta' [Burkholderiales bacterium]